MISLNEYDDIATFLPLKGENIVKECKKTYSGLMNLYFTISKESIFDK